MRFLLVLALPVILTMLKIERAVVTRIARRQMRL